MAQRINEDIRFYLPADPYYYEVDNLPLEDLLANDVRLQSQIDSINSAETGNTVGRAGFTELQPFIDTGLPGTVSVRPGNFIGRTQRAVPSGSNLIRNYNGSVEMNNPPTTFGTGSNPTGTYSVSNPANHGSNPGDHMARNALFNFMGGNISIDSFDFNAFEFHSSNPNSNATSNTPPLGRIDLIGITTVNGAMDDAQIPGNPSNSAGVVEGDGMPKLAVVKGAGITTSNNGIRQVVIGEKYITVGQPQESLNDYGRDLEGNVVPNPEFGTVPMPDDVVNVSFARDIMANGEISQGLHDWGLSNKNASFFLPIAYVYVPQSHVEGAPIPQQYLSDIRPFFRTAELAYAERQAIAASLSPSIDNPFVTEEHAKAITGPEISDLTNIVNNLAAQVAILERDSLKTSKWTVYPASNGATNYSDPVTLPAGTYVAYSTWNQGSARGGAGQPLVIGINKGNYISPNYPNLTYFKRNINEDDDTIATHSFQFTLTEQTKVQLCSPYNTSQFATGTLQPHLQFSNGFNVGNTVGFILAVDPTFYAG